MHIKSSRGEETVQLVTGPESPDQPFDSATLATGNDVMRHINRLTAAGATGIVITLTKEESTLVQQTPPTKQEGKGTAESPRYKTSATYPAGVKVVTEK
jgi:hypothetical protein